MNNFKVTDLSVVKKFEGCHLKAYRDPVGIPTIGWGTTKYDNGKAVKIGDVITQKEADRLLTLQVQQHADTIKDYVKVQLNQNQFNALASFQYNCGKHILKGSKLLNLLNNKKWVEAMKELQLYNKARDRKSNIVSVLPGLTRRRKAEAELFLTPVVVVDSGKEPITKTESITETMKNKGMVANYESRKILADLFGMKGYTGTTEQNIKLKSLIMKKVDKSHKSISVAMNSIGMHSSFNDRKKFAKVYNIKNYSGTTTQNILLLNKLKGV